MSFLDIFSPIASGLGSLLGGISSISSSANNLQATRETNETNIQLMREQNQFNHQEALDSWNRQTDFYRDFLSPAGLMKQYQLAGINPNGSQFSPTGSPSGSQASAAALPALQSPYTDPNAIYNAFAQPLNNVLSSLKTLKEIKKVAADTDVVELTRDNFHVNVDAIKQRMQREQTAMDLDRATIQRTLTEIATNKVNLDSLAKINQANLEKLTQEVQNLENSNAAYDVVKQWSKELGIKMTPEMANMLFNYIAMTASEKEEFNTQMQSTIGSSFGGMFKSENSSQNDIGFGTESGTNHSFGLHGDMSTSVNGSATERVGLFGTGASATVGANVSASLGGTYNYGRFGKNSANHLNRTINNLSSHYESNSNSSSSKSYNKSVTSYKFHKHRLQGYTRNGSTHYNHRMDWRD